MICLRWKFELELFACFSLLLGFIGRDDEEGWKGYFYAFLLVLATLVTVLTRAQSMHIVYITGVRVKTALMCAVYRKALKIAHGAKQGTRLTCLSF